MSDLDKKLIKELELSRKNPIIGELYPILRAKDKEIVDGFHREKAGWKSERILETVETRLQKLMARYFAHKRRIMHFEEKRALMDGIAEELIKQGIAKPEYARQVAKEFRDRPVVIPLIAELLGITPHTVNIYISDKYKRGTAPKGPVVKDTETHRSKLEMRADMLKALKDIDKGMAPTRLMYKTNLSWNPLNEHLKFLKMKELIFESPDRFYGEYERFRTESWKYREHNSKRKYIFLTELGREVLSKFLEVQKFLIGQEEE